jgi:hypothetical protein
MPTGICGKTRGKLLKHWSIICCSTNAWLRVKTIQDKVERGLIPVLEHVYKLTKPSAGLAGFVPKIHL